MISIFVAYYNIIDVIFEILCYNGLSYQNKCPL
jgi:hypothetical protein